jgi:hypothetical protein
MTSLNCGISGKHVNHPGEDFHVKQGVHEMPKGDAYSGDMQGESGMPPKTSRNGAYGYVSQRYGGADTPNMQGWNSYTAGPMRDADVKGSGSGGVRRSKADSDY